ncbi:PREDICTED: uncharacterized protein LOC105362060 [Ceratosolen solmsi marchali]|uniref:Uncharacterized protein LOC105362060 n=1 Tax=Ceratosolen solmsi marchali TaxID=326594 RepID=A0AAJ6YGK1_9HYME|nr:PREDICTED: uncharacterized protein LOC105362060 [Ceratosolen solmsi marchali]
MLTDFLETTTNAEELNPVILIKLCNPKYQFIDYAWNEKLTRMLMIQQNINNGMSWLSTLGGAFSSLGDEFDNCVSFL